MKKNAVLVLTCPHCKKDTLYVVEGHFEDFICPHCRTTIIPDDEEWEE